MKKSLRFVIAALALLCSNNINAQYQLANNGFEEWEEVTYKKSLSTMKGNEPVKWSSFVDATGGMKSMGAAVQLFKETETKHSGAACAKITARSVLTVIAQGNLTNGCVNMGSTSASEAEKNYNYINESREDQSMKFTGRPDAVKVWVNFSGSTKANVEVILTTKGYYQSPEANTLTAKKVAHAQNKTIAPNGTWTELTIPFTYSTNDTPYYSLVNISTSAEPGKGAASDVLYVDDIIMVYNSELASATYNGANLSIASKMTVDEFYDENKLTLTSNGKGATIEKAYDEESALLTITVKGDNISEDDSNKHTYTIQFKKPTIVNMTITDAKYATFVTPYAVTAPQGVTVYRCFNVQADRQLILAQQSATISANIPVILYSENPVSQTFSGVAQSTASTPKIGLLTGVYSDTPAPKGSYVLQNIDGVTGFYKVVDAIPTVKANRCYITLPTSSSAKMLSFATEEEETAINAINALTSGKIETIYNASGVRQSSLQKGMNIVKMSDGSVQKILVK